MTILVQGGGEFEFRVDARVRDIEQRAQASLWAIAGILLSESQRVVPIDLGNLKNSGTRIPNGDGFNFTVIVGYSAKYAIFVHECVDCHFQAPNAQAKYLEEPARRLMPQMKEAFRRGTIQ